MVAQKNGPAHGCNRGRAKTDRADNPIKSQIKQFQTGVKPAAVCRQLHPGALCRSHGLIGLFIRDMGVITRVGHYNDTGAAVDEVKALNEIFQGAGR